MTDVVATQSAKLYYLRIIINIERYSKRMEVLQGMQRCDVRVEIQHQAVFGG